MSRRKLTWLLFFFFKLIPFRIKSFLATGGQQSAYGTQHGYKPQKQRADLKQVPNECIMYIAAQSGVHVSISYFS